MDFSLAEKNKDQVMHKEIKPEKIWFAFRGRALNIKIIEHII